MKFSVISGLECKGSYIRIGNNHIFLNLFAGTREYIKDIHEFIKRTGDMHQHVHIFVSHIIEMDKFIECLALIDPLAKITIHIPRKLKDYKRMIEYQYTQYLEKEGIINEFCKMNHISWLKVIVESKGTSFKFTKGSTAEAYYHKLDVVFTEDSIVINLPIYHQYYDKEYEIKYLHNHSSKAAIQTKFQRDNMEMYKDVIIKNFRRVCPKTILKTLDTNDKIWEYITQEGEWTYNDEVESRRLKLDQEAKDMDPKTLEQKGLRIMQNSIYGMTGSGSTSIISEEEAEKIKGLQERLKEANPDEGVH